MRRPAALSFLFLLLLAALASPLLARGGGGCFLPGTLVSTPDGPRPIETLQPGQAVLSFSPDGSVQGTTVQSIYSVQRDYYFIIQAGPSTLRVTAEHPVYVGHGEFAEAADLRAGDTIYLLQNEKAPISDRGLSPVSISSITRIVSPTTAYNLGVEGPHTFFADGVAVHNKGGGGGGCFLPGTQVSTPSGPRSIESLQPGDVLTSFDARGRLQVSDVQSIYSLSRDSYYRLATASQSVDVTAEHPFLTPNGYVQASDLRVGDAVYVRSDGALVLQPVLSKTLHYAPVTVYNLQVGNTHTFVAGGFAVHNKGGGHFSGPPPPPPNVFLEDCLRNGTINSASQSCCSVRASTYLATGASVNTYLASKLSLISNWPTVYCMAVPPSSLSSTDPRMPAGSLLYCSNAPPSNSLQLPPACPFSWNYFIQDNTIALLAGLVLLAALLYVAVKIGIWPVIGTLVFTAFIFIQAGGDVPMAILLGIIFSSLLGADPKYRWVLGLGALGIPFYLLAGGDWIFMLLILGLSAIVFAYSMFVKKIGGGKSNDEWSSTTEAPSGKVKAKAGKVSALLAAWSGVDAAWGEKAILASAKSTFLKLQDCWSSREYAPMEPLLTPELYAQHTSQLDAMAARHEKNRMDNVTLLDAQVVLANRYDDKSRDELVVWFKAQAKDTIVDDRTGAKIRGDTGIGQFEEFWTFARAGNEWKLSAITQPEEGLHFIGDENFDEWSTRKTSDQIAARAGGPSMAALSTAPVREQAGAGAEDLSTVKGRAAQAHRLLNFLSSANKMWDEASMRAATRTLFIQLSTAMEKGDLAKVKSYLSPELAASLSGQLAALKQNGQTLQKRNLALRDCDIVLVRNRSNPAEDEFTAWVSGQSQTVLVNAKTEKIVSGDSYVRDFEEYWTFGRASGRWALKEIASGARARDYLSADNIDEGTSKDMMNWYYKQDRAV